MYFLNLLNNKRRHGTVLMEAAATLVVLLPVIFIIFFVMAEASQVFMISTSLTQAARQAARDLAIDYGRDPTVAASRTKQDGDVFDNIRITTIVVNSQQFADPIFDTSSLNPSVTVTVTYAGGQYGLSGLLIDPLHLGRNHKIQSTSTYRLE